ncbi:MAG: hypothetical protein HDT33_11435 [Clostridiales bacterium]|nr:hypothetical protein [Clostridiales bacterium]
MKRILSAVCVLALMAAGALPALAAESPAPKAEPEQSCYYPVKVEEYTYGSFDEPRIDKVYQLSLGDDPSGIPTEDFIRNGRLYYLLDMVRKDEIGVDTQTHTETVTLASDTDKMDAILQRLDAEMEFTTEDGYTGTLRLDHTSVQVTTDGYASKTSTLSATRTYPNLSDADVSLVPKTITDNGHTLNLADVQWSSSEGTDGEGGIVTHYTATAKYTGSSTSRYATGYTVTANYVGEVAKTDCQIVTYTATFGSMKDPGDSSASEINDSNDSSEPANSDEPSSYFNLAEVKTPVMMVGMVLILVFGGAFALKKIRRR